MKYLKIIILAVISLFIIGGIFGYRRYTKLYANNVLQKGYIYIPTGADYEQVLDSLQPYIKDKKMFALVANQRSYPKHIKPGKYKFTIGEGNLAIINKLKSGDQVEQQVPIKNFETIYQLAGKVSKSIETDSTAIVNSILNSDIVKREKLTDETAKYFIRPDTYNMWWNTNADDFVKRMEKEHKRFWTTGRVLKAKNKNLTPLQATTLAAIVQKEVMKKDELPTVAGLYLNRLKKGMKLQSDPTAVYAKKKRDGFGQKIMRVLNSDINIASDFNTYQVVGLPPAPICLPNTAAVEAVLNPKESNYIFMCASPVRFGYHDFTASDVEHVANAKRYREWLDAKHIKR